MKTIKVKTVYNGQVGFPEKYWKPKAIVQVGNLFMDLDGLTPTGYSEYMQDKFGRGQYRLVYFNWNGEIRQLKLSLKAKKEAEFWEKYNKATPEQKDRLIHSI